MPWLGLTGKVLVKVISWTTRSCQKFAFYLINPIPFSSFNFCKLWSTPEWIQGFHLGPGATNWIFLAGYYENGLLAIFMGSKRKIDQPKTVQFPAHHLHTVNPLLSPGGFIYFRPIWGGRGWGRLSNLEKTMVLVFPREPEYKVQKLKHKKVGGLAAEDRNKIWPSSW